MRDYGRLAEDLPFMADGNMSLTLDPKQTWAETHLRSIPVKIMTASREQLLRVPDFGPKAAETILKARRQGHLTELAHLQKLHIHAPEQAAPYILLSGKRPLIQAHLF